MIMVDAAAHLHRARSRGPRLAAAVHACMRAGRAPGVLYVVPWQALGEPPWQLSTRAEPCSSSCAAARRRCGPDILVHVWHRTCVLSAQSPLVLRRGAMDALRSKMLLTTGAVAVSPSTLWMNEHLSANLIMTRRRGQATARLT